MRQQTHDAIRKANVILVNLRQGIHPTLVEHCEIIDALAQSLRDDPVEVLPPGAKRAIFMPPVIAPSITIEDDPVDEATLKPTDRCICGHPLSDHTKGDDKYCITPLTQHAFCGCKKFVLKGPVTP